MPGSTVMRLRKLRTKSSAVTSSTMETATWTTTMMRWREKRSRRLLAWPSPLLRAWMGSALEARKAGRVPKTAQVRIATAVAKRRTRQSVWTVSERESFAVESTRIRRRLKICARRDAEESSGDGEERGFDEELAKKARACGSEGHADGDLALASAGAGEHEVGEVGAGDEEDETGDAEEDPERGVVGVAQVADAGGGGERAEFEVAEQLGGVGAVALWQRGFKEAFAGGGEPLRGAFDGPAGLEAAHDVDVEVLALHFGGDAERRDEVEALANGKAEEARRRDTDDVVLGPSRTTDSALLMGRPPICDCHQE